MTFKNTLITFVSPIFFILCTSVTGAAYAHEVVPLQSTDIAPSGLSEKLADSEKTLMLVWASWCSECKSKLKDDLPKADSRSDLQVISLNIDTVVERAKDFAESEQIKIPIFRNPSKSFQKEFKIFSVPHWVVFSSRKEGGKILGQGPGWDQTRINQLIAEASK
jgi:hypothetical protein